MTASLDSFETIYREHHAAVWRFVLHLGVSRGDAPDVTHNVFSIAYRKLDTFEGRSSLRTWLCSIAFRVARDRRKSAAFRLEVPMSDPPAIEASSAHDVATALRQDGLLQLAEKLLDALPAEQREVFVLHELEELTGDEIAALMGTPLGTVRSRLRRARAFFRKQLAVLGQAGALSSLGIIGLPRVADASSEQLASTLLEQLRTAQPPPGALEQGWCALAAELSAHAAGATTASVATTHSVPPVFTAAKAALGSRLVAALGLGMTVTTGLIWTSAQLPNAERTSARSDQVIVASASSAAPATAEDDAWLQPVAAVAAASARDNASRTPARTAQRPHATTLAEEGRLLARANELVQAGQGKRALQVLRMSETRYPRSVLSQEREVLTTEALAGVGATDAAELRARRFIQRHPHSPHAARLKRFME